MANQDGLILIDKGQEMTSFQVVKAVKRLLGNKKVGHTGTLDPLATGLLPICLGRGTKLSPIVMAYQKEYDVWARFGQATDSHDCTGQVIEEKPWDHLTEEAVNRAVKEFEGEITQVPPMFSAIKYRGRPLYWYAHKGIVFPNRKERRCHVHEFTLLEWRPPRARFLVRSSQGTYVRTLVHDLAQVLGTCAMVDELRRTACGLFKVEQAIPLEQLEAMPEAGRRERVLSLNEALPGMFDFQVDAALARRIRAGRTVMWADLRRLQDGQEAFPGIGDLFKVTGPSGDLLAVASLGDLPYLRTSGTERGAANRIVRTLRVFH